MITFAPDFVDYGNYVRNYDGILEVVSPNTATFQPNLEEFEQKIGPRTKAVIINTPNNPTGVIYSCLLYTSAFITCWNEYLLSYTLLTDSSKFPISVGLKYLVGEFSTDYGSLAAGCIIALIPPILLFAYVQKHLVQGMNAGAVKG